MEKALLKSKQRGVILLSKSRARISVKTSIVLSIFCIGSFFLFGCSEKNSYKKDQNNTVIVFAAASLTNVVEELAERFYEKENISILISTGSSSTLARQIEQGSSADIYFSANKKWADYLLDLKILDPTSISVVAHNSLVLITPAGEEPYSLKEDKIINKKETLPAGILSSGRIALGDPDHVPAGIYGKEALVSLGVYSLIKDRIIPCASVRDALLLVEHKEADWGIVYKTDALSSEKVQIAGSFLEELHSPVRYFLGVVDHGEENDSCELFYDFCLSKEGRDIYEKFGFISIDSKKPPESSGGDLK